MKNILTACLILAAGLPATGQNKHNYNWPLGYGPGNPALNYGGSLVAFSSGIPEVSYFNIQFAYSGDNTNISDKNGKLVAYTNGCQIQNREHVLMENGEDINPGIAHQQQCSQVSGYSNDQGSLFLPMPGSDSLYFLFHLRDWGGGSIVKDLMYSVVDISVNNGLGEVLEKNQLLLTDTLTGMITACRHANGRDWWLVVQENYKNLSVPAGAKGKYYLHLFDPYGVHYAGEQQIGKLWTAQSWVGQSCFSPNGSRYAIGNIYNGINLFDFDRCSGVFSNPLHLGFSPDTTYAMGMAFSPNSRFLYVTTGLTIVQFDLVAPDVESSKQTVAVYDGYLSPFPTTFYQLMLAPDDKIYGSCTSSSDVLHVIHQPDSPGLDCQIEQHGLQLLTYHAYTTPNLAYHGLYDEQNTICDSLGIDGPPPVAVKEPGGEDDIKMVIIPNPASHVVTVNLDISDDGQITLTDMTGKIWLEHAATAGQGQITLNAESLLPGIYLLIYQSAAGHQTTQKLVVQH